MDDARLKKLRDSIDEIDQQILSLLAARLRNVLEVGELKRAHGVKVYDADREREVLDRLASGAESPLRAETARRIFERIIDESRSQEQHHVAEPVGRH